MKGSEECFMKNMIIGIAGAIAVAALGGTGAFASGQMSGSSPAAVVQETVWESDAAVCPYDGACHTYEDADNDGICDQYENEWCGNSGGTYGTGCHGSGHHGSGHHNSHHGGWHE